MAELQSSIIQKVLQREGAFQESGTGQPHRRINTNPLSRVPGAQKRADTEESEEPSSIINVTTDKENSAQNNPRFEAHMKKISKERELLEKLQREKREL
jgi:hypothetical protein